MQCRKVNKHFAHDAFQPSAIYHTKMSDLLKISTKFKSKGKQHCHLSRLSHCKSLDVDVSVKDLEAEMEKIGHNFQDLWHITHAHCKWSKIESLIFSFKDCIRLYNGSPVDNITYVETIIKICSQTLKTITITNPIIDKTDEKSVTPGNINGLEHKFTMDIEYPVNEYNYKNHKNLSKIGNDVNE